MRDPGRWPAPWVFSLLILPLGIIVGFKTTPLPFLLARAGVPVDRIARVTSLVGLPGVFVCLWAPIADIKLRRRTWLAIAAFATALSFCIYVPLVGAAHVNLMTALILAGGVADSLVAAACGGLIVRALSIPDQAKASAWFQVGLLGGGALGGAAVMWLAARLPLFLVGAVVAVLIALPGFFAFTIPEPPPLPSPWFQGRFRQIGRELWAVVRLPERRWGTLLLLAPGSTGAAAYLLPAIASHYGVGANGVMWINGLAGGLVVALGALCGAFVPSDWDRRLTYVGAGMTNGLAALVLLAMNRPSVYLMGTLLYLVTSGLCGARWTALMVEIVGSDTRDASTVYGALNAVASISIFYMIWLDGVGFHKFGTHGLLWTDAGANLLVFAVVASVFAIYGLGMRRAPRSQIMTREASRS
jgi:MFS transporter, PAT family, beta-lactamase induction signal transducer AmpG